MSVKHAVPAPFDRLSPRELEVVTMIAEGARNAQIAEVIGCSPKTVDTHRSNALKKLDLKHNVDLTREAIRFGLVKLAGAIVLNEREASIVLTGIGYWASDYNDAPHDEIKALEIRLMNACVVSAADEPPAATADR